MDGNYVTGNRQNWPSNSRRLSIVVQPGKISPGEILLSSVKEFVDEFNELRGYNALIESGELSISFDDDGAVSDTVFIIIDFSSFNAFDVAADLQIALRKEKYLVNIHLAY